MSSPIIRYITQNLHVFLIKKIPPQTIRSFLLVTVTFFPKGMWHLKLKNVHHHTKATKCLSIVFA